MKFDDYRISPDIKKSLEKLNFRKPTDIQFRVIPSVLKGEDVLAIAQTGTGKTAAFAIPVIHKVQMGKIAGRANAIKCVVMVPTRELAVQIAEVFSKIGQYTRVNTINIHGGVEQEPQIAKLTKGADIIVVTPGRLFDLVSQGFIKLDKVETVIFDEADHMLDKGFLKDLQDLIRHLPVKRQTLFFSATINETIKKLAYSLVKNPIRIQLSPKDPVSKNVDHAVAFITMDDKRFFLERLIHEHPDKKILVFVRTKVRAERVIKALARMSIPAVALHGDKDQHDRLQTLGEFRGGQHKILVATDVSARGIDIPNVDYVVNYDIPDVPETYVHRVGRTGRAFNKGYAVAFCSEEEKPLLQAIESYITKPVKVLDINRKDYTDTLAFTTDVNTDWKSLLREEEQSEKAAKLKKRKKK